MSTLTGMRAELGGGGVHRDSQNPHVVKADIVLLRPRPFLKLQILNVFHHLWPERMSRAHRKELKEAFKRAKIPTFSISWAWLSS